MLESLSRVDLIRVEESEDGSFGVLLFDGRAFCVTLEPEDNGNAIGSSNIPHGAYRCERVVSPRFGETFEVTDVPGRSHILFHAGNTEDDTAGCILLARRFGVLGSQRGVLNSGATFREFLARLSGVNSFELHISEAVPQSGEEGGGVMADWKSVGEFVSTAAPVLGGVLGGPLGVVAGAAGKLVASFLGVEPEPEAVMQAVQDPQTLLRLKELEVQKQEMLLGWQGKQLDAQLEADRERTQRHKADMASDSWLSKNVRPLCLLIFTAAVVGGTFATNVSADKLKALTDLGYGIYGYYFVGRSAFDKGAVKIDLGRKKQ